MHEPPPHMVDDQLIRALRARGLRVTPQRLLLHRALRAREGHATADELLREVQGGLPHVALPTVYSALALLEDLELVRRVGAGGGTTLYDSRMDPHHHAVCRRCGSVHDVEAPVDAAAAVRAARTHGFRPEHEALVISGLCGGCASSSPGPRAAGD